MLKKGKIWGFTFFIVIIFSLHILNLDNLNTVNSIMKLSGEDSSNVLIENVQKMDIISNQNGDFFVLSSDNTSTKISVLNRNFIESNQEVISTQLNLKYLDAKLVNNDIYLLVINSENLRQIIKMTFSNGTFSDETNICFQFLDESLINSFYITDDVLFFIENGTLWGSINMEAFEISRDVNSIFLDFSGNYLYVVKENNSIDICSIDDLKESIDEKSVTHFTNLTLKGEIDLRNNPVNFLNDDLFMSSTGQLFKINTSQNIPTEIEEIFKVDVSESSIFNCATIFNFESKDYLLCKISKNKAGLFDIQDNLIRKYNIELNVDANILNICSSSSDTLLIYKDSENKYYAKMISEDDLIEEIDSSHNSAENPQESQNPQEPQNPQDPQDPQNPQETQNPSENENKNLLGEYKMDEENKYILGVELGTTVAAFKQNLNLNGEYTVTFKNYAGKDITSGKLGTGSVVTFWKDDKIFKEYTLVVNYDVTGEGNFNSRDFDYMYNHIFRNEKTVLSGEYFRSGDMDNDGKIDTLDLLKMKKALN